MWRNKAGAASVEAATKARQDQEKTLAKMAEHVRALEEDNCRLKTRTIAQEASHSYSSATLYSPAVWHMRACLLFVCTCALVSHSSASYASVSYSSPHAPLRTGLLSHPHNSISEGLI